MSAPSQATSSPHPGSLTGAEKVAVLLLALGKQRAAKILRRFDAEDLKLVTQSVGELPQLTTSDLERLVEEFAHKFSNGVKFMGSATEVKDLLSGVMTEEEIAALYSDGTAPEENIWKRLSEMKVDMLRGMLLKEHPQAVALILSKIDAEAAAKAVTSFPPELRNSILRRMLAMKKVSAPALGAVENALREMLRAGASSQSHLGIADILNRLDKAQSEEVLRSLSEMHPEDAKALKSLLFTFEDLTTLPQRARTVLFDQVPVERLVLALRGTEPEFQSIILSSLASRSKRMVEAELQSGSTATQRDIASARRQIVDMVLKMIARGEIELAAADVIDEITV
ncbi:MAG: flagellar motor switch protein FliG [Hyphomicrobiaceae bacterium]|nr:MAG: flagellar motor switch protein FliG [Hyphomicrobiaceae bacterium]